MFKVSNCLFERETKRMKEFGNLPITMCNASKLFSDLLSRDDCSQSKYRPRYSTIEFAIYATTIFVKILRHYFSKFFFLLILTGNTGRDCKLKIRMCRNLPKSCFKLSSDK